MKNVIKLAEKLCISSRKKFYNPYSEIEWPESISFIDDWHYSCDRISIFFTDTYKTLPEEQKKKLAFFENINFFSLNIHGEKDLIAGMADRLYGNYSPQITEYIHHFLDEENKHMNWFGTYCMKYAGKIYQENKIAFPREYADGEEELLFFLKIVIFEEIVDNFNVRISRDESVHPTTRQIHKQHHIDESRHLSFGREISKTIFLKHSESWSSEVRAGISEYVSHFIISTWKEYYNPEVYIDSGIDNAYDLMEEAWSHPESRELRESVSKKLIDFLIKTTILTERVKL